VNLTIFLLSLLLSVQSAFAAEIDDQTGHWVGTFVNKPMSERFSVWAESQIRFNHDIGGVQQVLYRTGVLQRLSAESGIGYLYAFIQTGGQKEHRLTLQHTQHYGSFINMTWSHRLRAETRFLERNSDSAGRVRYLVRGEGLDVLGTSLVIWDECFFNLTREDWTGNQFTERNRFFLGLRQKVSETHFEFGYLNQYVPRSSLNIMEHLLVLYIFI